MWSVLVNLDDDFLGQLRRLGPVTYRRALIYKKGPSVCTMVIMTIKGAYSRLQFPWVSGIATKVATRVIKNAAIESMQIIAICMPCLLRISGNSHHCDEGPCCYCTGLP